MADASPFLTAHDSAERLTRLARAFSQLFTTLGVPHAELPAASRVARARVSRVLGEHAQVLAALVPESVLLADARAAGARSPLPLPADPAGALRALDRELAALLERSSPVADGALRRLGTRFRSELADLTRDLDECVPG